MRGGWEPLERGSLTSSSVSFSATREKTTEGMKAAKQHAWNPPGSAHSPENRPDDQPSLENAGSRNNFVPGAASSGRMVGTVGDTTGKITVLYSWFGVREDVREDQARIVQAFTFERPPSVEAAEGTHKLI